MYVRDKDRQRETETDRDRDRQRETERERTCDCRSKVVFYLLMLLEIGIKKTIHSLILFQMIMHGIVLFYLFFFIFKNYLHFKGYSVTWFSPSQKPPISSHHPLLLWWCSSTHPHTPASWCSIPLHWGIYGPFIGPRTSLPIDAWQGHPLLSMQLKPCVLLGCWLSPWELEGVGGSLIAWYCCSSNRVVSPFSSFRHFSNSSIGDPTLVQWLAVNTLLCICKALTGPLRRQLYEASLRMHFLASTIVSMLGYHILDEFPSGTVSTPYVVSIFAPESILFPCLRRTKAPTLRSSLFLSFMSSVNSILGIPSFGANIHLSVGEYHVCSFVIGLPHSWWHFLVASICLTISRFHHYQ